MSNYKSITPQIIKKYNTTTSHQQRTAIVALIRNQRIHQQQYNMISSTTSPAASTGASIIGLQSTTYSGLIQKLDMSDICRHTPTDLALTVHV